jgi:hypothetical protein
VEEVALFAVVVSKTDPPDKQNTDFLLGDTLLDTQKQDLLSILREYQATVFTEPKGLPPRRTADHKIDLVPGSTPPARAPYRLSQPELDELRKQLQKQLDEGWIQPSSSPFAAPLLFVKKKSGELRMCVDYRALNNITVKNKYPLPLIGDLLDRLTGAKYFTSLDLRSGYHQVRISEGDVEKTAFTTRYGQFEYLVMPFGLTNAPSTFQALMNRILQPYLDNFVVVYLDDILIYSKTFEDHVTHVRLVLEALRTNELRCALDKCTFATQQLTYLGFVIGPNGVQADPKKTAPIADWPEPKSTHDVHTFMGLANYFQRYVPKMAELAAPLTDLLKGDHSQKFVFTAAAHTAFHALKHKLTHTPVLQLPDFGRPFNVTTDASKYAIGMMLSQTNSDGEEKPVAFDSRKFRHHELNWTTTEKEAFAVVHALKIWRHYVDGSKVTVYSDHIALKFLLTQPKLNARQARWVEHLQSFDLEIVHLPGKLNAVADAPKPAPRLRDPRGRGRHQYLSQYSCS